MQFLVGTGLLPVAEELAPLAEAHHQAILESLYLAVVADGRLQKTEMHAFTSTAMLFSAGPPAELLRRVTAIAGRLGALPPQALHGHLAALRDQIPTQALREKTFAGMVALLLVDGRLDEHEHAAALGFAHALGIEGPRAHDLGNQVLAAFGRALRRG